MSRGQEIDTSVSVNILESRDCITWRYELTYDGGSVAHSGHSHPVRTRGHRDLNGVVVLKEGT